jgi:C_GCAxxG_C_C family probable redox protein
MGQNMSNVEKAVEIFRGGLSCSQAVLGAYCEQLGLDEETAYKIGSGFGGGMHLDQACGAVTGAFMVIGLKFDDDKMKVVEATREFAEKFKERHGSVGCTELIGCDVSTPEGLKEAVKKDLFKQLCPEFVESAAQILEEIIT